MLIDCHFRLPEETLGALPVAASDLFLDSHGHCVVGRGRKIQVSVHVMEFQRCRTAGVHPEGFLNGLGFFLGKERDLKGQKRKAKNEKALD
jgi:hypothetical protein